MGMNKILSVFETISSFKIRLVVRYELLQPCLKEQ